jgi:pyruvate dehydrogenase (quinone)
VLDRLIDWGVEHVYGYRERTVEPFLQGIEARAARIAFTATRHQELPALLACEHAKFTGQVGVCIASSEQGAIHVLPGLKDATMDRQPVLAIMVGKGSHTTEIVYDLEDVAQRFVGVCSDPSQVRPLVDRAMRIARGHRSPTCVIVPEDVLLMSAQSRVDLGPLVPLVPTDTRLRHAADVLR